MISVKKWLQNNPWKINKNLQILSSKYVMDRLYETRCNKKSTTIMLLNKIQWQKIKNKISKLVSKWKNKKFKSKRQIAKSMSNVFHPKISYHYSTSTKLLTVFLFMFILVDQVNAGQFRVGNINLISKNIRGKLYEKLDDIIGMANLYNADFFFLQELKLCKEDYYTKLKDIDQYAVFVNCFSRETVETIYKEKKRKKILKNNELNEEQKQIQLQYINPKLAKAHGGLMTLIKKDLLPFCEVQNDEFSRFTIVTFRLDQKNQAIILVNVYGPSDRNDLEQKNKCFRDLRDEIRSCIHKLETNAQLSNFTYDVIIGGDFNIIQSYKDRTSNQNSVIPKCDGFNELKNNLHLLDPYRHFFPRKRNFTYFKNDNNVDSPSIFRSRSRIDFWLVRRRKIDNVIQSRICKGDVIDSDHKAIYLQYEVKFMRPYKRRRKFIPKIKTRDLEFYELQNICQSIPWNSDLELSQKLRILHDTPTERQCKLLMVENYLKQMNKLIFKQLECKVGVTKPPEQFGRPFVKKKEVCMAKRNKRICNKLLSIYDKLYFKQELSEECKAYLEEKRAQLVKQLPTEITVPNSMDGIYVLKELRKRFKHECDREINKMRVNNIESSIKKMLKLRITNFKKYIAKIIKSYANSSDIDYIKVKVRGETKILRQDSEILASLREFWQNLFHSKVHRLNTNLTAKSWFTQKPNITFQSNLCKEITLQEVINVMGKMKRYKSPGEDRIPIEVIENLPVPMLEELVSIYNVCFQKKDIPKCWKEGIITLIYKTGDKGDRGNYRPITLLSVYYKIFTSILRDRLEEYVCKNNLISEFQAGFRKGATTFQQICLLRHVIEDQKKFSTKKQLHVIYVDLICIREARPLLELHEEIRRKFRSREVSDKEILSLPCYS
jgi:exonuclease III